MNSIYLLVPAGFFILAIGAIFGYFARQSIARKKADRIETILKKKIESVKKEAEETISKAKEKAAQLIKDTNKDLESQRKELFRGQKLLMARENTLTEKASAFEKKEEEFGAKVEKLRKIKESLEDLRKESIVKLEKVAGLGKEDAKKELFSNLEDEYKLDLLGRMQKLEEQGQEKYELRAKEIIASVMQRYAASQAKDITTTSVSIPSDDLKGRIIGKEGRNIRVLEKVTGVEIIIDETPGMVTISAFDPVRRHIAKLALEKLLTDGKIQPARIEETVSKIESEINEQMREAGERAVYETGIVDFHPKLIQLLGRLKFRSSYSQNVLLHSIEVSFLAEAIAAELGADMKVAKRAGLLHDIGKAVDHQVEGSHVNIGIRILEKFGIEEEVIWAMRSHHEEYPFKNLEAVIVKIADQISGARPGARRDTVENYIKRLQDLEDIATSFEGVDKAYAIAAGREIRVFVNPDTIDDLKAKKLGKDIAGKIQQELKYPGEIKVIVIRENRIIEYAK